jgi:hypothetical protein
MSTAIFCWLVVVPVWRVRKAVEYIDSGAYALHGKEGAYPWREPTQAVRDIRIYLRMPDRVAPQKRVCAYMLRDFGKHGLPLLEETLRHRDEDIVAESVDSLSALASAGHGEEVTALLLPVLADRNAPHDLVAAVARPLGCACAVKPVIFGMTAGGLRVYVYTSQRSSNFTLRCLKQGKTLSPVPISPSAERGAAALKSVCQDKSRPARVRESAALSLVHVRAAQGDTQATVEAMEILEAVKKLKSARSAKDPRQTSANSPSPDRPASPPEPED